MGLHALVADKAIKAFKDRIRELTPRVTVRSLRAVVEQLRIFMRGEDCLPPSKMMAATRAFSRCQPDKSA